MLTVPANGAISTKKTNYGVKVTYTCDVGYNVIDGVTKTCLFGGKWSPGSPRCKGTFKITVTFILLKM